MQPGKHPKYKWPYDLHSYQLISSYVHKCNKVTSMHNKILNLQNPEFLPAKPGLDSSRKWPISIQCSLRQKKKSILNSFDFVLDKNILSK